MYLFLLALFVLFILLKWYKLCKITNEIKSLKLELNKIEQRIERSLPEDWFPLIQQKDIILDKLDKLFQMPLV